MSDEILKAAHYNHHPSGVECIEVTRWLSNNRGNAFKYIFRRDHKAQGIKDLRKALYYVRDEIKYKVNFGVINKYGMEAITKICNHTLVKWERDCYWCLANGDLLSLRLCEQHLKEAIDQYDAS